MEIHCLAIAELLENNTFDGLDVYQLVSVLSIFCDLRLSDENKIYSPDYVNVDKKIIHNIKQVKKIYNKYYDLETKYETEFMFNYNLQFDLVEIVYNWAKCDSSEECQKILNDMQKWDIFIGNFSKAILKICNISFELENICNLTNKYDLLEVLKQVPNILQKFMITNNSLYI